MTIYNIDFDDDAEYTIQASNGEGKAVSNAELLVRTDEGKYDGAYHTENYHHHVPQIHHDTVVNHASIINIHW